MKAKVFCRVPSINEIEQNAMKIVRVSEEAHNKRLSGYLLAGKIGISVAKHLYN